MRVTRITLLLIAGIIALGFYQLARNFLAEVEPQTFQATEEMMVDCAQLMAELVGPADSQEQRIRILKDAFNDAHRRNFSALIHGYRKESVGIHAYLTDADGMVIFDSDHGKRVGLDYSQKRDVALTLLGGYGARSSRENPSDLSSSVLYVAAPVGDPTQPTGVLTLYKPQLDVLPLIRERRRIILTACGLIGGGILFLITAVFLWLFHPIGKITDYARAIQRGERPKMPKIGIGREVNTLASALETMRETLENRSYVKRYVETLTHEMKSPLAAIRGAAELLEEEMPVADRQRFTRNILTETARSERLISRLLELSAIESKTQLDDSSELDFRELVTSALDQARSRAESRHVGLTSDLPESPVTIIGNRFILRAAITNLLENAIDFSPDAAQVEIRLTRDSDNAILEIRDHGPGIPEFAKARIFERFYSLRHPESQKRGTGLGLTLVKEAADLHLAAISLTDASPTGTIARWIQPLA